jgi:hypothetical protein
MRSLRRVMEISKKNEKKNSYFYLPVSGVKENEFNSFLK